MCSAEHGLAGRKERARRSCKPAALLPRPEQGMPLLPHQFSAAARACRLSFMRLGSVLCSLHASPSAATSILSVCSAALHAITMPGSIQNTCWQQVFIGDMLGENDEFHLAVLDHFTTTFRFQGANLSSPEEPSAQTTPCGSGSRFAIMMLHGTFSAGRHGHLCSGKHPRTAQHIQISPGWLPHGTRLPPLDLFSVARVLG